MTNQPKIKALVFVSNNQHNNFNYFNIKNLNGNNRRGSQKLHGYKTILFKQIPELGCNCRAYPVQHVCEDYNY